VDLTTRAVEHTRNRLSSWGLVSGLQVADAENLPFPADSFDIVYSWGVLHHSPDTPAAIREVHRVLRPGGIARVMIYHTRAIVGYLLWARYGLLRGHPSRSLADVYAEHLESPGTKAYSVDEARRMFSMYRTVHPRVQLSFGDLLEGAVGQRHAGAALTLLKRVWPRWLVRRTLHNHGLCLLIEAVK
jgi:SAM-dependent methyltransferase